MSLIEVFSLLAVLGWWRFRLFQLGCDGLGWAVQRRRSFASIE
jgi:hypothetical protein